MKKRLLSVICYLLTFPAFAQQEGGAQRIPGRVYCAFYDTGGEGAAYHDADPANHGSGELNPLNGTFLHAFRAGEGVDTSYTKAVDETDISEFNRVDPPLGLLYVGWTEAGEWTQYSVAVAEDGVYDVSLLHTANSDGAVTLDIDGEPALVDAAVPSTFDAADPVAWRQWHHWGVAPLGSVRLSAGAHILTLRTSRAGGMNYAALDFRLIP